MSAAPLCASERETTVTVTADDEVARFWSCIGPHITRMRRDPMFTEVAAGWHGTTEWAEFTVPADRWSPVGVIRRRAGGAGALAAVNEARKAGAPPEQQPAAGESPHRESNSSVDDLAQGAA